jgi:hypothetical protein
LDRGKFHRGARGEGGVGRKGAYIKKDELLTLKLATDVGKGGTETAKKKG